MTADYRPPVSAAAFDELERGTRAALERYANVHRGTGQSSIVTTELYERARHIVLDHLGLGPESIVLFLTPWRRRCFVASLARGVEHRTVSSAELGLPLGVCAVALRRADLPQGVPFQVGGGTIRMVSPGFVDWAGAPGRFEAGTPNIVGAIAMAKAICLARESGPGAFRHLPDTVPAAGESGPDEIGRRAGADLLAWLKPRQIGWRLPAPVVGGELPYTNLDNAASTPTFEPVWQAFCRAWRAPEPAWPGIIAAAREQCHRFFGAPAGDYDVVFAAGTTEAVNIVAASARRQAQRDPNMVVLNTEFEHNSDELPWRYVPGLDLVRAPVDGDGFVDLGAMERILAAYNEEHRHGARRVRMVCVCGASNVMGTYNDLLSISRVVHRYGSRLLVDAAQLSAHRPVEMLKSDIDLLAFSAHKTYAPFGSGAIICRKGMLDLDPAEQAAVVASGEENVAGIAALGQALELLERIGMEVIMEEERRLTCRALAGLADVPGLRVYGVAEECAARFNRKGGVVCFELAGVPHNLAAQQLAELGGIGVRNGCFCVNMYVKRLLGIDRLKNAVAHLGLTLFPGLMSRLMVGLVRASLGLANDDSDVDRLIATLKQMSGQRKPLLNRLLARLHFGTPLLPRTSAGRRTDQLVAEAVQSVYASKT